MNSCHRLVLTCLPAMGVLLAITAFFRGTTPQRIVGDNLIKAEDLARSSTGGIALPATRDERHRWLCEVPDLDRLSPLWLLVQVRAQTQSVRRGKRGWDVARADFVFLDPAGRELEAREQKIMAEAGSHGWRTYSRFFPIPPGAVRGCLSLQNDGTAGVVRFSDLAVFPAIRKASFVHWRFFLLGLWLGTFLVYMGFLKLWRRPQGGWLLLLIGLILAGAALPEESLDHWLKGDFSPVTAGNAAETAVSGGSGSAGTTPRSPLDSVKDWGHTLLFFLLAYFTLRSYSNRVGAARWRYLVAPSRLTVVAAMSYLLLFAAATEVLQFFVPSRHVSLGDWGIDALGIALALSAQSICWGFSSLRLGRRGGGDPSGGAS